MRRELYHFTVPGRPVGYYAQGKFPNWKRKIKYEDYKRNVQRCMMAAGVKDLFATKERPLWIHTTAYFPNGVHPDPGNVQKGIVDAMFWGQSSSRDKYTGGSFAPPLYDTDNPRVEVVVEEEER